ncbi:SelB C-terminal domain-containing protein [Nocardioides perillae]|uniref:Selenocysteine-specific elongation factor n=1 Tax=Nocardioides perillae TaxID=1119534 RepID=A0A7Y9UJX7_9ACTN|nr:selenocysteine-specific elongation factor [Nocardioides perillae]
MHVIATAGHVDHGKSTLVDALTGMRSDRLAEEQRRGLSIELGYVWTELAGETVAFVDVPGHERFVTTMLAGVGPVPAALLVVAADDPWMPQAAEHLAALDALGVRRGVVAVTRADLADPGPAVARAVAEVARTGLVGAPVVPVSAVTGAGVEELREALVDLVAGLPEPDPTADVRLWVDRVFSVRGAGTVVTGTLPAGRIARDDRLVVAGPRGEVAVRVRGVQALGADVASVDGVARVALNVVGDGAGMLERGSVLTTPGAFVAAEQVDVLVTASGGGRGDRAEPPTLPEQPVLHVGAASVSVRVRPLGRVAGSGPAGPAAGAVGGELVRLRLARPLPLRVGDRALLRDPGSRAVWGVEVLDPLPPGLRRRGAAAARVASLTGSVALGGGVAAELARRGVVDRDLLRRLGVPAAPVPAGTVEAGDWLLDATHASELGAAVATAVAEHDAASPLDRGVPLGVLAERLGVPSPEVVAAVVAAPLRVEGGRVRAPEPEGLPPELERAVAALERELADAPFAAPGADRLVELGLDTRRTAAAAKAGRVLRLAPGVVLLAGADRAALEVLTGLPQPFTTSEARVALATSRRVVLPLLDHLDRARLTVRHPDDTRSVRT